MFRSLVTWHKWENKPQWLEKCNLIRAIKLHKLEFSIVKWLDIYDGQGYGQNFGSQEGNFQEKLFKRTRNLKKARIFFGLVLTRYCVSVRPNHSCFTAWLCQEGQRYPCAVWTKELRLEPVATVSSGHRQWAGWQAIPDLGWGAGASTVWARGAGLEHATS